MLTNDDIRKLIEVFATKEDLKEAVKDLSTKIVVVPIKKRVILLDEGKIVTNGETREVLSNKSLMEYHGLEVPLSLKYG